MRYLAALDYDHLDDGVFLSGLAQAISKQKNTQPVILHADSAYTERIMQTGVMREDAVIRSQKDLNHRLVALFADEGISAVGVNGYQRELIRLAEGKLRLDREQFSSFPDPSAIILSTLVWDEDKAAPVPVALPRLTKFMQQELDVNKLFIFNRNDERISADENRSWDALSGEFKEEHLPEEFQQFNHPAHLTTALDLQSLPDIRKGVRID